MRLLPSTWRLVLLPALLPALLLSPFTVAHALRAGDMPPPAPEAVRAANAKPAVREGQVTAVSTAGDRVEIDGAWFRLVDGQTRVYRQGRAAAVSALAKGQRVSFSTVVDDANAVGVIYVQ